MKILFNTVQPGAASRADETLLEIATGMAHNFPNDQITILYPEDQENPSHAEERVRRVAIQRPTSPVLKNYLLAKRLRQAIVSAAPDVIFTTLPIQGTDEFRQVYLPSSAIYPFLNGTKKISEKDKDHLKRCLEISKKTLVFSQHEKDFLIDILSAAADRIEVAHRIIPANTQPLAYEERLGIKDTISGGNEYFLCSPADDSLLTTVLKGFSGFKKWQRSHMRLILLVEDEVRCESLSKLLSNYRFHEDVQILPASDIHYEKATAAAYALIAPDKYATDLRLAIRCIAEDTPLIIPSGSVCDEIVGKDAFHFAYNDKDDIARVMLESFRDENKRSAIIRSAAGLSAILDSRNFFSELRRLSL